MKTLDYVTCKIRDWWQCLIGGKYSLFQLHFRVRSYIITALKDISWTYGATWSCGPWIVATQRHFVTRCSFTDFYELVEAYRQWRTQDFIWGESITQIICLPGWELVALAVLSLWGTMHGNFGSVKIPLSPPRGYAPRRRPMEVYAHNTRD